MSHWFFLSYARENHDRYLLKFYSDLNSAIRGLTPPGDGEEGFLDQKGIGVGEDWPDELTTALQTCRTFVPLYSPPYFEKETCGKEWQLFSSRQAEYAAKLPTQAARPSLILPILWTPEATLRHRLPEALSQVQYSNIDFGELYPRIGLWQIMKLRRYRDHYHSFLACFAKQLIQAASENILPPSSQVPNINKITSAFHRQAAQVAKGAEQPNTRGPRFVQFVFVAGRRDELREVRERLDHYGEAGGYDWQPYSPEFTDEVGIIAQEVAWREKLHYRLVEFDNSIMAQLDEAESNNKIVAIVIDTWTLCLPRYSDFMHEYDRRNFVNCVVLVPWNSRDDESEINRSILVNKMWGTFRNHAVKPDPNFFRDSISSPEELKNELSTALNRARARISARTEVVKKAESGQIIGKPLITAVRRTFA